MVPDAAEDYRFVLKITRSALNEKQKDRQIDELGKILKSREEELELRLNAEKESKKRRQAKDEELETLRLMANEKQEEVARLKRAFEDREQELRKKIAEKNTEIAEKTALDSIQKKVLVIKGRSLWKAVKACFMLTEP
jgi:hypothetical protein